jgi:uncharacterized membrane protein YdjX (TVP38/TMEM64 family)
MAGVLTRFYERLRELGKLTPIALITVFLPMAGAAILLMIASPLSVWLRENSDIGMPLYLFGVLFFCGLAMLPTNVIGIVGGWAFGLYAGLAILITGVVGSAVISYLIHSRIVGDKLPDVAERHPKADAIYNELVKRDWWRTLTIIFLVRASIIMPFALTNFLMASARVRLDSYALGTFAGMFPRSFAMAMTGAGLSEFSLNNPSDSWFIAVGIIATVLSALIIGMISRKALDRMVKTA